MTPEGRGLVQRPISHEEISDPDDREDRNSNPEEPSTDKGRGDRRKQQHDDSDTAASAGRRSLREAKPHGPDSTNLPWASVRQYTLNGYTLR
jgi:hypothetical protein